MPKLHKPLNEDGMSKTRPIVGAGTSLAARAFKMMANVIDAFMEGTNHDECESTADMVNKMEKAEEVIKQNKWKGGT